MILLLSFIILPWLAFDLYFLMMSLALILLKNKPLQKSKDLPAIKNRNGLATILIPIYNNAQTVMNGLIPALKNMLGQNSSLPLDVILVDSSTDGTEEKIREALNMNWFANNPTEKNAEFSNLTLVHLKNRRGGKSWAINSITQKLKTRYFAILDSDWILSFEEFRKAIRWLEDHPNRVYAQIAWRAHDKPLGLIEGLDQVSIEYRHQLENRVRDWKNIPITIHGTAVVIRTTAFQKKGGFDDSVLSEDVDLSIRFMLDGEFGGALSDISMQESPCDHMKQFFWQKARWAEGRSQMLRKYTKSIIKSPYLKWHQKIVWIYYLAYFGRCVGFSILLMLTLAGILLNRTHLMHVASTWLFAALILRFMSHLVTYSIKANPKIPFVCRLIEPFSFYGIGLIYTYTFFSGLFKRKGVWHVIERQNHAKPAIH